MREGKTNCFVYYSIVWTVQTAFVVVLTAGLIELISCSVAKLTNIIWFYRCRKWVQNTRRQDLFDLPITSLNLRKYVLCSDHFEENQFLRPAERNRLVWNACCFCKSMGVWNPQSTNRGSSTLFVCLFVIFFTFCFVHVVSNEKLEEYKKVSKECHDKLRNYWRI